jgi:pimeloyl-ACP methyl ester carboxylesterase
MRRITTPALWPALALGLSVIVIAGATGVTGLAPGDDDPLPRKGMFGARIAEVSRADREALKLEPGVGVRVDTVFPGSTAAEIGLEAGDVVTAVGDATAKTPAQFVELIAGRKAGEPVAVTFVHDGKSQTRSAALKPRPRESVDGSDVVYGSVESRGKRLRTILTRPRDAAGKKLPALFVIQGLGSFSVESLVPGQGPYARFIDAFARKGWVTFRVDKPGQGDSEGGPTRDVDFATELDGYRQALKALKAVDAVDPDRVVIFGHSMGGVMGPLVAANDPVRGIAAYGTVAKTWTEYMLENTRRQKALAGDDFAAIDRDLRRDAAIYHHVYVEGVSPGEVAEKHPELKDRIADTTEDGRYFAGRHHRFFAQLAAANLPEAWSKFTGHALAAWGQADFVATESDHALIAEVVNRAHPGHGTFLVVRGSDHGFSRASSWDEAFQRARSPSSRSGEFNPAFLDALTAWADKVVGDAGGG